MTDSMTSNVNFCHILLQKKQKIRQNSSILFLQLHPKERSY